MTDIYNYKNDKRKYYRIKMLVPMCTEMTISNCHGKEIKTGYSNVCVTDIGPGGLSFVSPLSFPIDNDIIYRFRVPMFNEVLCIKGVIVRRGTFKDGVNEYGINFIFDQREEPEYIKMFNRLSIVLRKNSSNSGCKICKEEFYPCKK